MLPINQTLSGNAVGGADLRLGQKYLSKIRTVTGKETAATNSFAENIKNIKTKIATQDVYSKSSGLSMPTTVKCEWPDQPRPSVNPEVPSDTRCELPQLTLNSLFAQKEFKAGK
jgi:hypothetical protein